ncbi:helix-turn-helix transcriptional regulator, partial [Escherichia coli]|nr:helix-turn-helix transcriptional regulator [Escherichia coli]
QWKLEHISELMYISNVTLRKRLSAENKKFTQILLETRMNHALELLLTTDKNITTISRQVGYGSVSYFIKLFKKHYGETPKKIITQRIR